MSNPNAEMKALADSLWNNYFQPKVADATRSCLRLEKATVKAAPSGGTVAVQLPFDDTVLNLPTLRPSPVSLSDRPSGWAFPTPTSPTAL